MTAMKRYPRATLLRIATPLGVDLLVDVAGGRVISSRFARHRKTLAARAPGKERLAREVARQVAAYFKGTLERFTLPLAFEGTPFECEVWRQVASLAFGEFVSYADVARAVGRPLSHRGVARAVGRTQHALFVPAQRVVGADGKPRGVSPASLRLRLIAFERGKREDMATKRWSQNVTERSSALDIEPDVFKKRSAKAIAQSLKSSAEHSTRRKGSAYQSAMSMLNFYINRAGKNLSESRLQTLERAKAELRKAFGREP